MLGRRSFLASLSALLARWKTPPAEPVTPEWRWHECGIEFVDGQWRPYTRPVEPRACLCGHTFNGAPLVCDYHREIQRMNANLLSPHG